MKALCKSIRETFSISEDRTVEFRKTVNMYMKNMYTFPILFSPLSGVLLEGGGGGGYGMPG
jgi:hypothetical protein